MSQPTQIATAHANIHDSTVKKKVPTVIPIVAAVESPLELFEEVVGVVLGLPEDVELEVDSVSDSGIEDVEIAVVVVGLGDVVEPVVEDVEVEDVERAVVVGLGGVVELGVEDVEIVATDLGTE